MKCVYINLDSATDRRSKFEANWAAYRGDDWALERLPAIDTRYVADNRVGGRLQPAEKACFLSHCLAIGLNRESTEPLYILEDDAVLGPSSATKINDFLKSSDNDDWDIVFTEVGFTRPSTMIELIKLRQGLMDIDEVRLLDLSGLPFAGATGYIVNPRSLKKIASLIGANDDLDVPYDLLLRHFIYEKELKGSVLFPFVSSLSDQTGPSQIRIEEAADRIWTAFRQLVWLDRDLAKLAPSVEAIRADLCDDEARMLGVLLGALTAKSFRPK